MSLGCKERLLLLIAEWRTDLHRDSEKIKEKIRERLEAYDDAPVHPDLNSYGSEENFEWRQYFLRDDDSRLARCPFHDAHTEEK